MAGNSKLLELMSCILKDIFYYYILHLRTSSILEDIFYYYSRLYPPTLSSEISVVSEINYLELSAVRNSPTLPYMD